MSQRALLLLPGKARCRWRMGSHRWSSWRVVMQAQLLGTAAAAAGKLGMRAVAVEGRWVVCAAISAAKSLR